MGFATSRVKGRNTMKKTYEYAVMDGNDAPDQDRLASSCHHTLSAAKKAAARENAKNPNNHYYVISWEASRWARERACPSHPTGL